MEKERKDLKRHPTDRLIRSPLGVQQEMLEPPGGHQLGPNNAKFDVDQGATYGIVRPK